MLYNSLFKSEKKKIAVLIDPGKQDLTETAQIAENSQKAEVDFFLVGGSLVSEKPDKTIEVIREYSAIPVILFPGSILQVTDQADGILLLSLISGRNPDFLIGNHVLISPFLKKSSLEIISTGYMLIDGERRSSVEYISNTKPIPSDKGDIITATAMAGEMLGNKCIYLEAGSGAKSPIDSKTINEVKKNITIPLIVGGGIKDLPMLKKTCLAGADIIVTGNAFEKDPGLIRKFSELVHSL